MRRPARTVGVLGGMGPIATHDFFGKVLAASNARTDDDHIRLIIDNNPFVPDRNAAANGGPSPGPALAAMARGLEAAGAELLAMPCNAAHAWADEIRAAVRIPFVHMIEETVASVRAATPDARRVGVLAADGCLRAELYQDALFRAGSFPLRLAVGEQAAFMDLIYRVKGGKVDVAMRAEMRGYAERLLAAGAEAIVAGCTEIPLALAPGDITAPLIESTTVLAQRVVVLARAD
ncbi:MAG: amino acid racemase [Alphaproteobacteria bacterium]|nr:amino acid racemase [Alphaproteobacteria bacterium]